MAAGAGHDRSKRGKLPYYGYLAAESLVRILPRRAAYAIADRAADFATVAVPAGSAGLVDNLRHVVPGTGRAGLRRLVRRNVRGLARNWVDLMELRFRGDRTMSRVIPFDLGPLEAASSRGRGVVVVSMHFGAWEAAIAMWNGHGRQLALVAEVLHPPELFERILSARRSMGVQVIPIDTSAMRDSRPEVGRRLGAAAMREVVTVLRRGGSVAMAMDRDLIGNGARLPFFGEPAPIPVGVVDIAIRTGAAIVPIVLWRSERDTITGRCYPEIEYDATATRGPEVFRVARRILAIYEEVIRARPEQWHVLDRIWTGPGPKTEANR